MDPLTFALAAIRYLRTLARYHAAHGRASAAAHCRADARRYIKQAKEYRDACR